MSPLNPDEDEVSVRLSNGSFSRRLSKISDSEEIKLLNDSQLNMTADDDEADDERLLDEADESQVALSHIENSISKASPAKEPDSIFDDVPENASNIDPLLADFEENLAYDENVADESQQQSCKSDASTILNVTEQLVLCDEDKPSIGATPLMARLRKLNADARRTTLAHCQTPLGPSSRLSVGIKRQSFAKAVDNLINQSIGAVDENDMKKMKQSPMKMSAKKASAAERVLPDSFTGLVADLTSFYDKAQNENDFVSTIQSGIRLIKETAMYDSVVSDIDEVLLGAVGEANLSVFSDETLNQQWNMLSHALDKSHVANIIQNGTDEGSMEQIAGECVDNINGKYKIWEARLLEISADSIVEKAEAIREDLEAARNSRLEIDEQIEILHELQAPFDKSSAEMELFELRNKIQKARRALERSKDDALEIGGEISSLLQTKQVALSALACSSSNVNSSNAEEDEAALITEKRVVLENLKLSIDAVNKLTWCYLSELNTRAISMNVSLTENFIIEIHFALESGPDGSLVVSKVSKAIKSSNESLKELSICQDYLDRVLCNDQFGILGQSRISMVKSVANIKSIMRTV
jgi:hypothetical protein